MEGYSGLEGKAVHLLMQVSSSPYLPLTLTSTVIHGAAPLLQPSQSQTFPVSSGIYFQPSRFLSIRSRNPLAILCPDGRLQMKGTGSWRVFSWPASQQPAGTRRQAEVCTDKALLHCKSPSILLHSFPQCPLCHQTNLS